MCTGSHAQKSISGAFILGRKEQAETNTAQTLPEGPSQLQQEEGRGCRQRNESTACRELGWLAPTQRLPIKQAQKSGTECVRGLGSPSSTDRQRPCSAGSLGEPGTACLSACQSCSPSITAQSQDVPHNATQVARLEQAKSVLGDPHDNKNMPGTPGRGAGPALTPVLHTRCQHATNSRTQTHAVGPFPACQIPAATYRLSPLPGESKFPVHVMEE